MKVFAVLGATLLAVSGAANAQAVFSPFHGGDMRFQPRGDTPVPIPAPANATPTPVPAAADVAPAQAAPAQANDDPDRTYRIGEIVVGDHVQVDPSLQNYWRPAVVTQVKTMIGGDPNMVRGFVIRDESGYTSDVMATPRMIKK